MVLCMEFYRLKHLSIQDGPFKENAVVPVRRSQAIGKIANFFFCLVK